MLVNNNANILLIGNMLKRIIIILLFSLSSLFSKKLILKGTPELFLPGIISSEVSEVKITFSEDGKLVLWGTVGKENERGALDIWQSVKSKNGWGSPMPVSFNSKYNDFDPSFSADGKKVYFFSNRPGGLGGDDLYFVSYDSVKKKFSAPINMGKTFNTTADEWGPAESVDGQKFIFCTNGLGGKGQHDIFISHRDSKGWGIPKNVETLNSVEDDFDPVILHDCSSIIFTRKISEEEAFLFISYQSDSGYSSPVLVDKVMNIPDTWNFGSSVNYFENEYIYYSTSIKNNSIGRLDIYRIKYSLSGPN